MLFIKVYISQLHQYSGIFWINFSRLMQKSSHCFDLGEVRVQTNGFVPPSPHPSLTFALFSRRMENTDEIVRENTTIAFVMFALLFSSAAF